MRILFLALVVCFSFSAHALDKQKILNDLANLYPYLSADQLKLKIKVADSPDKFFRSFVNYYYFALRTQPGLVGNMISLGREGGWCVGDGHISNLGSVIDRNGKPHLTVNDLDDGGPCPLVADYLRFLVSARLEVKEADLVSLVRVYKFVLQGSPWNFTQETKDFLDKAAKLGPQIDPDNLVSATKLKRDKNAREVTDEEKSEVLKTISRVYKNSEVTDLFATVKEGGGSHGLLRFKVLVKIEGNSQNLETGKGDPTFHLIQFKRLVDPAIASLAVAPVPSPGDRIKTSLNVEQGDVYSIFYNVQNVNGMIMLLSPVRWGNIPVDAKQTPQKALEALVLDESKVMALIHKKMASDQYIASAIQIPEMDWVLATKNIHDYMKAVFETLNK